MIERFKLSRGAVNAQPRLFDLVLSLPQRAERIRSLVNVARGCIIEIGRELIAAKSEVEHGEWLNWLKDEFGWGHATASNYMNAADKFRASCSNDHQA
jgi:hypothetical protein